MLPELISYELCPYVHKAAIVLRIKQAPHRVTYIDLKQPPEWFKALSPLGKVPLLRLGDQVLFESAAIIEYLDEVSAPRLHPQDLILRAQNRAWMAFADGCLGAYYRLVSWQKADSFPKALEKLHGLFDQLERVTVAEPFFNGPEFSLVDATYGPLFFQLSLLAQAIPELYQPTRHPKLYRWQQTLAAHDAVRGAVVSDFWQRYRAWLSQKNSVAAMRMQDLADNVAPA